jgi:hypothetical protein
MTTLGKYCSGVSAGGRAAGRRQRKYVAVTAAKSNVSFLAAIHIILNPVDLCPVPKDTIHLYLPTNVRRAAALKSL